MSKHHSFIDTVDQVISDAVNKGIMHLNCKKKTDYKSRLTDSTIFTQISKNEFSEPTLILSMF